MRNGWSTARLVPLGIVAILSTAGCATVMEQLSSVSGTATSSPEDGLREALIVGTGRAVETLGQIDGYLADASVRIGVPHKLEPVTKALRTVGAGRYVDEFETAMNRAAEAAAPLARQVFVDTVREMTFTDAMTILRGHAHEATDYLRDHAGPRLAELFRPIVDGKLEEVGATRSFNRLMDETAQIPFVSRPVFDLGDYVTERALDGLFQKVGAEEERIRQDPVARTTELLRRWFGE